MGGKEGTAGKLKNQLACIHSIAATRRKTLPPQGRRGELAPESCSLSSAHVHGIHKPAHAHMHTHTHTHAHIHAHTSYTYVQ